MGAAFALKTVEWADIAGSAFAALAAFASWMSVKQARKSFAASLRPQLNGYWFAGRGGEVELAVDNTGNGYARNVSICVASGTSLVKATVGSLSPGTQARIETDLPAQERDTAVEGVLLCLDAGGRWNAWAWDGRYKRYGKGEISFLAVLASMYPGVRPDDLTETGWSLRTPATVGSA